MSLRERANLRSNMLVFWNIRGLNDPHKQYLLKKSLEAFSGEIICLLETHTKEKNQEKILQFIKPGCPCLEYYPHAVLRRISVLHNPVIKITVMKSSTKSIHFHVFSPLCQNYFFLLVIYAFNDEYEKNLYGRSSLKLKLLCLQFLG